MRKIFTFETFWNLLLFMGNFGCTFLMIFPLNLDFNTHFLIAILFAIICTKLQVNQVTLENKIFELKQLIEKKDENNRPI